MSRNAAIILSISEYDHEENLPACLNDHGLIRRIIEETGKYELILELSGYLHSFMALDKVCNSIDEWRKQDVGEILFYYSGHGILDEGQFLFPFSNYHPSSKNATSLSNSRLDELLRGLSPSNAVKMVDACYSGTEYIKGAASIQDAMCSSMPSFKSLYFFYSSRRSKESYVGDSHSNFTQSIAKSLLKYEGKTIRYYDIISLIRDEEFRPKQEPFFVTQGPSTEIFCEVTANLAEAIRKELACSISESPVGDNMTTDENDIMGKTIASVSDMAQHEGDILVSKLEQISHEYQTKEEAMKTLSDAEAILRRYQFDPIVQRCYDHDLRVDQSVPDLPSLKKVAEWIQRFGEEYFVQIEYKDEVYEANEKVEYIEEPSELYKSILGPSMFASVKKKVRTEPVSKTRLIAAGYSLPQGFPFTCLHFVLEPYFKALPAQDLYILPILSSRKMRVFYKQEIRKKIDYEQDEACDINDWASAEALLMHKKDIDSMIGSVISQLEKCAIEAIHAIVGRER